MRPDLTLGAYDALRVAVRRLAQVPAFSLLAIGTLGLGAAGATVAFTCLRVALADEPAIEAPEDVARLWRVQPRQGVERGQIPADALERWRAATRSFQTLAGHQDGPALWRERGRALRWSARRTSARFFAVIPTRPLLGRLFWELDTRAGADPVALLGYRNWRERFGGDPNVVGRALFLDGRSHTIVGVLPQGYGFMGEVEVWLPLTDGGTAPVLAVGRKKSGLPWPQAQAEIETIGTEWAVDSSVLSSVRAVPVLEESRKRLGHGLLLMLGPSLLVLLIACGNVSNLLLVRAAQRRREIAVRLALGAPRWALVRDQLAEGVGLALGAAMLGPALAAVGFALLRSWAGGTPLADHAALFALDRQGLAFALLATLATPPLFSAASALHAWRADVSRSLRIGPGEPLFGFRSYHLRDLFVILEMALAIALVLLTQLVSGLFRELRSVDLGFDPRNVVVVRAREGAAGTQGPAGRDDDFPLEQRLRELPGVAAAAAADGLPAFHDGETTQVQSLGEAKSGTAARIGVGVGYFETLGVRFLSGRSFGAEDTHAAVAVVSTRLAQTLWPARDAIGQALRIGEGARARTLTVVGVVPEPVRFRRLAETDLGGELKPWVFEPLGTAVPRVVILRSVGAPAGLADTVRSTLDEFAPDAVVDVTAGRDAFLPNLSGPDFLTRFLGLFCGLALALATVGVFGVMSQAVKERVPELGVRLALGASPAGLARLLVGDGLVRIGVAFGLALAVTLASVRIGFREMVEVALPDPLFWGFVCTAVAAAALLACALPARRASRIEPVEALRCE